MIIFFSGIEQIITNACIDILFVEINIYYNREFYPINPSKYNVII